MPRSVLIPNSIANTTDVVSVSRLANVSWTLVSDRGRLGLGQRGQRLGVFSEVQRLGNLRSRAHPWLTLRTKHVNLGQTFGQCMQCNDQYSTKSPTTLHR